MLNNKVLNNKAKNQKGVSIFLALIIMTVFLAISLGLSVILLGEIKMIREMGYSVIAFYAADTGMEEILYLDSECGKTGCSDTRCRTGCSGLRSGATTSDALDNGALYEAEFSGGGPPCFGRSNEKNATSTGSYKGVKRSVETMTESTSFYLSCDWPGKEFGGYCWYEGAEGENCAEVCVGRGGNVGDCTEGEDDNCAVCQEFYPAGGCTWGTGAPAYASSASACANNDWACGYCDRSLSSMIRFCACCW